MRLIYNLSDLLLFVDCKVHSIKTYYKNNSKVIKLTKNYKKFAKKILKVIEDYERL